MKKAKVEPPFLMESRYAMLMGAAEQLLLAATATLNRARRDGVHEIELTKAVLYADDVLATVKGHK